MSHVDYFLKVDGIEGESHDAKHKGAIQLQSWSWRSNQQGTWGAGGGGGAGKVEFHDIDFVTFINKASPKLALACASGQHIPKAVLICRKAGGQQEEFSKWTLSNVLVSSYQNGGAEHGTLLPLDHVSLHFDQLEVEYREQKNNGTLGPPVKAGWNTKQNKAV
jgi:type VI secretion system secreted protein Hcp